jgi:DNA-binding response OmpR family regulator
MTARILLADDEPALIRSVTYALERDGYEVDAVGDGASALDRARSDEHDLAIIDVMMPALSGLDFCRQIRTRSALPVILLTARDSEIDTVLGLEAGADDYVTKPFSVAELTSRVGALLRRRRLDAAERGTSHIAVAGLDIDPVGRTVEVDGADVRLTSGEFDLLLFLAESPGAVLSREAIMEHLWRAPYSGDGRAADTHISNLRRKIEPDVARPSRIVTVRGSGYKLASAPRP